jgi:hypothetical protein
LALRGTLSAEQCFKRGLVQRKAAVHSTISFHEMPDVATKAHDRLGRGQTKDKSGETWPGFRGRRHFGVLRARLRHMPLIIILVILLLLFGGGGYYMGPGLGYYGGGGLS